MSKALILGCSHAQGAEIDHLTPHLVSYPARIASKLGYQIDNRAIKGGSNDAMFRIFENEFSKLQHDDLVITCWSGINRTEFFDEEKKEFLVVNLGSKFKDNHKIAFDSWVMFQTNEYLCQLNKIKNILALNYLAQSKKLQVINVHSFWPTQDFKFPEDINFPIGIENLWDWALAQGFPKTVNGHFYEDAHDAFAEYILSKL